MTVHLTPGITAFMFDNEQLATLAGAVQLPIGTRLRLGRTDYIVHGVEVGARKTDFDIYYMCHPAEETGADYPPV